MAVCTRSATPNTPWNPSYARNLFTPKLVPGLPERQLGNWGIRGTKGARPAQLPPIFPETQGVMPPQAPHLPWGRPAPVRFTGANQQLPLPSFLLSVTILSDLPN